MYKTYNVPEPQSMDAFNDCKLSTMENEKRKLELALKAITKTIDNIKSDVHSRMDDRCYRMWWNRIENISNRFKVMYSNEANGLYDYIYKKAAKERGIWEGIMSDVKWIRENVFVEYDPSKVSAEMPEEGDLPKLFSEGTSKRRSEEFCQSCEEKKSRTTTQNDREANNVEVQPIANNVNVQQIARNDIVQPITINSNVRRISVNSNVQQIAASNDVQLTANNDDVQQVSCNDIAQPIAINNSVQQVAASNGIQPIGDVDKIHYENISSDEESENVIINEVLSAADEVGTVDMNGFSGLIDQFMNQNP